MTRKDYVVIAAALNHASGGNKYAENERLVCCSKIADVLQADNPRFDRNRFLVAAGWPAVLRDGKQWQISFVALDA